MIIRHRPLRVAGTAVGAALALSACSPSTSTGAPGPDAASSAGVPTGTPALPAVTSAISMPADDLSWVELPDGGGVRYASTRGDLAGDGPYEAFVEFPAGADNPFQTHSADLPTVVLSGTFYA